MPALGVSHASVYRYFPSKSALRDAVVQQWLEVMMPPLEAVAAEKGPAPERLRRWLDLFIAAKRKRATEDPELFAAYHQLACQARELVGAHIDALAHQAARVIADGVAQGEFACADPIAAGRAILYATCRFHNPAHAAEWTDPGIDARLDEVWHLLLRGSSPAYHRAARAGGPGRGRNNAGKPGRDQASGAFGSLTKMLAGVRRTIRERANQPGPRILL